MFDEWFVHPDQLSEPVGFEVLAGAALAALVVTLPAWLLAAWSAGIV